MRVFSYSTEIIDLRLIFIFLSGIVLLLLYLIAENPFKSILTIAMLIWFIFVGVLLKKLWPYIKGDNGELDVARTLKKLPKNYYHLRDFLEGQKGNTDAIVVGPTGVWTIEVKNYKRGTITFKNDILYNDDTPLEKALSQPYAEAKGMEDHVKNSLGISLQVNPVLVFTNPKTRIHFGLGKQRGVYVIGKKWLLELIQNQNLGHPLTPEQCILIKEEVKKYTSAI